MQLNLTNYHSHCSFCDGKAPIEEFVKAAINAGFISYGVSSHAPLPFPTHWTLDREQVSAYLQELDRLKKEYAGQIELYAGMEIDYLDEEQNPGMAYFRELPLDYRIGSVHLIYTPEGEVIDTDTSPECFCELLEKHFRGDLEEMVTAYLDASVKMVETGGFDFVGHADKITYNASFCAGKDITVEHWFAKRWDDYLSLIAEKGMMMEVNTKAWEKKGIFFPHTSHFSRIKDLGIAVLVNSDAHLPALINAGRMEALKALSEAGFEYVRQLRQGKWEDVQINLSL